MTVNNLYINLYFLTKIYIQNIVNSDTCKQQVRQTSAFLSYWFFLTYVVMFCVEILFVSWFIVEPAAFQIYNVFTPI
jgi:hypothetical protein